MVGCSSASIVQYEFTAVQSGNNLSVRGSTDPADFAAEVPINALARQWASTETITGTLTFDSNAPQLYALPSGVTIANAGFATGQLFIDQFSIPTTSSITTLFDADETDPVESLIGRDAISLVSCTVDCSNNQNGIVSLDALNALLNQGGILSRFDIAWDNAAENNGFTFPLNVSLDDVASATIAFTEFFTAEQTGDVGRSFFITFQLSSISLITGGAIPPDMSEVPLPAAAWMFLAGIGLIGAHQTKRSL